MLRNRIARWLVPVLAGAALGISSASASASVSLTENSTWRPATTNLAFPSNAEDSIQFQTHYLGLPATVQAGDIIMVNSREQFSNPTWASVSAPLGGWTISGSLSEHWSTPIMGACGIKRGITPGLPSSGSWVSPQVAENFDGIMHHWVYDASEAFVATAADASSALATVCYFSRALAYRDAAHDYVIAETAAGRIEAVVAN